jgi:hypothetical protein
MRLAHLYTAQRWRLPSPVLLALVLLGLAGCRSGGYAQQRVTERANCITNVVSMARESEQRRPQRLASSVDLIRDRAARDLRASRANIDECKRYWQRDSERWTERRPAYERRVGEILSGKPGHIERSLVVLFF